MKTGGMRAASESYGESYQPFRFLTDASDTFSTIEVEIRAVTRVDSPQNWLPTLSPELRKDEEGNIQKFLPHGLATVQKFHHCSSGSRRARKQADRLHACRPWHPAADIHRPRKASTMRNSGYARLLGEL